MSDEEVKNVESSRRSSTQVPGKTRPHRHRESKSKSNSTSSIDNDDETKLKKQGSKRHDLSKKPSSNRVRQSTTDRDRKDRDRKDRESKRRAKQEKHTPSSTPGIAIGVTRAPGVDSVGPSDKKSLVERRRTNGKRQSSLKRKDQEKCDRSSKRAARSSKSPTRPGAVRSDESDSAKSKYRNASHRESRRGRIDSEAKQAARSSRRSTRLGAESSNQADHAKAKSARKEGRNQGPSSRRTGFGMENVIAEERAIDDDHGLEIQAELVKDDTSDRHKEKIEQATNHVQQHIQDENERLRLEMEAMHMAAAKKKKTRCNTVVALVLLVLIGGGVGAFFATRGNSSEASVPSVTFDFTEATDSPTELILQSPSPSGTPSSSPTAFLKYPPPSQEDCDAVAQQLPVQGERTMPVLGYDIKMEVILSRDNVEADTAMLDIEEKLRSILIPSLVGCTDVQRRQLRGKLQSHRRLVNSLQFAIASGRVTVRLSDDGACETETTGTQLCYRIIVSLELSLKGEEKILDIMGIILQLLQRDDLVEFLSLNELVEILLMMTIASTDRTNAPSSFPTDVPSISPSMAPSSSPSAVSPSDTPSSDPTLAPVTGPTTDEPANAPTPNRTPSPTVLPTCPGVEVYFDNGSFNQQNGSQDESYSIVCTASTEIVALTYSSDTCEVQCVGSLRSTAYSQSCADDGQVRFVLPGDFQNENILIGYRSNADTLTCGTSMIVVTDAPTAMPFAGSTPVPTQAASDQPTLFPTESPSNSPSSGPTSMPTNEPTSSPTPSPTIAPTLSTPSPTARRNIGDLLSGYALDTDALNWLTNVDAWPLDDSNPNLELELLERHDMVVFYQATAGSSWTTSTDWLSSEHICAWDKVGCSNSRVTGIYTFQQNLVGSVPTEIGRFSNLQTINLSGNDFGSSSQSLPSEIGQLTQLTHIDINNSNLMGTIPDGVLDQLAELKYLNLKNNNLEGTIPPVPSTFLAQGCSSCFLEGNDFDNVWNVLFKECSVDICINGNSECNSYCLPDERRSYYEDALSGFDVNTETLNWLADVDTWYPNPYNPSVKREILERHDMAHLYLSTGGNSWTSNRHWLNGAHICGWHHVTCTNYMVSTLYLYENNLAGSIPTEIGRFSSLLNLNLSGNDFSASSQSLPTELGDLTQLNRLKICTLLSAMTFLAFA
ncbi:MAG: hypothetical protein SGBAC_007018 [Bacillariaceae sp.]